MIVSCLDCERTWEKRADSLKNWGGRCRPCAQFINARLESSISRRREILDGMLDSGWVPFRTSHKEKFIGPIADRRSVGKMPEAYCIDCGKHLMAKKAKRCSGCFHETQVGIPSPSKGRRGELHSSWKGGVTKPSNRQQSRTAADRVWSKAVLEAGSYTCQMCGVSKLVDSNVVLHADHINPWSTHKEMRHDVSNGRVLCAPCHRLTPTFGWRMVHMKRRLETVV